jgi:hypothetical protein
MTVVAASGLSLFRDPLDIGFLVIWVAVVGACVWIKKGWRRGRNPFTDAMEKVNVDESHALHPAFGKTPAWLAETDTVAGEGDGGSGQTIYFGAAADGNPTGGQTTTSAADEKYAHLIDAFVKPVYADTTEDNLPSFVDSTLPAATAAATHDDITSNELEFYEKVLIDIGDANSRGEAVQIIRDYFDDFTELKRIADNSEVVPL